MKITYILNLFWENHMHHCSHSLKTSVWKNVKATKKDFQVYLKEVEIIKSLTLMHSSSCDLTCNYFIYSDFHNRFNGMLLSIY